MKKGIILMCCTLLLASCGNDATQKATEKLSVAQAAFERGNYNEAKIQLDSIKLLYPKAFDVRREGNKLMQQVELKEQQQSLAYLDSMMQTKQEELKAIVGAYTLEKDATYQEEGNYFWPTQTVEKNLHRSFLRFQVNEQGVMIMTSIYCGRSHIHHFAVKVTAPDGTFAETPASTDSYETTDLGEKIEKADFTMGSDGNVMGFLYLNRDKNIKVEYIGERKYSFNMTPADRLALTKVYELSQLLSSMEQIKKEAEEAKLKIGFVKKLIEKRSTEEPVK
ncbi:hypothetical protein [Bacteroides sp.]|uniref:hypothetical protein n=1 Tax=Bacteroides sp. TaxID=29523 RepID=UPI001B599EB1|nr:hypothetical protein [Bacteroides sp.]MBP6064784.1 hypothetical protein [Bacteroides sp.]MBP6067036.1 hypothetical protein [Bacteroides sp.]MBP6935942.1 hypothetical protein [Bacteroides sp.]MBP8621291.1 hypothetical protein [Bacteroides sp.]MBP9507160.1 hypothetical protein [Bacteroides sp.]